MRVLLSILLAAHAIAHLPGFLVSWRIIPGHQDLPYRTTILGGRFDVGTTGSRVVGLMWLVAGFVVGLASVVVFRNADNWWTYTGAAVAFSTFMTLLGWPDSRTGAVLNTVVIAFLVWAAAIP